jgi:outer membrane protein
MKKTIRSLVAIAAIGAFALVARAETAVKILVIDMAKLYDNDYRTQEQNAKFQVDQQKAREIVDQLNKQNDALVEEFKGLQEQMSNPASTAEAKSKAENDAKKKYEEVQAKQNERMTFVQNTQQSLNQRLKTFQSMMLEEITKVAVDVAKRKGGTILIDKSGPSLIGVPNVIYADASFDITEDVQAEINKNKPAGAAAAPASNSSAPLGPVAAPSSSPSSSGPTINLPIAPKK